VYEPSGPHAMTAEDRFDERERPFERAVAIAGK
jgi:hypothetical protein